MNYAKQRIEKRIAYLQNIVDTRFPVETEVIAESIPEVVINVEVNAELLPKGINADTLRGTESQLIQDDGMTDFTDEELRQREEEEKILQEQLQQIELDKLTKRKPRTKK